MIISIILLIKNGMHIQAIEKLKIIETELMTKKQRRSMRRKKEWGLDVKCSKRIDR